MYFYAHPYIWPHRTLCHVLRYIEGTSSLKNRKMPSKHTTLTLLIPAKFSLDVPNTLAPDLEDPKPVATPMVLPQ